MDRPGVLRYYPTLEQAREKVPENSAYRVWAVDTTRTDGTASKKFLVLSPVHLYQYMVGTCCKHHYYEVISPNMPAAFYLDIEVEKVERMTLDSPSCHLRKLTAELGLDEADQVRLGVVGTFSPCALCNVLCAMYIVHAKMYF